MVECLVEIESVYNVETRNRPALLCYIVNKLFWQHWSVESEPDIGEQSVKYSTAPHQINVVIKTCLTYRRGETKLVSWSLSYPHEQ